MLCDRKGATIWRKLLLSQWKIFAIISFKGTIFTYTLVGSFICSKCFKVDTNQLKDDWNDSIRSPLILIGDQIKRLSLKEKPLSTFLPSKKEEIDELWHICLGVDECMQVYMHTEFNTYLFCLHLC